MELSSMDDPYDKFEDFEWNEGGSRGGGGGKRKNKGPTQSSKTARDLERQVLIEKRQNEAAKKIEAHIQSRWGNLKDEDKDKALKIYFKWIESSLAEKYPIVDRGDIERRTYFSGGPGGQHHQKNETAISLTHSPTLISAKNEDERLQNQNEARALTTLTERLEDHLKIWQETSEEFRKEKGIRRLK